MKQRYIPEGILWVIIAIVGFSLVAWAFWSRVETGGTPLVEHGKGAAKVYGAGGQQVTVSKIVFVDADGKSTLTIHAGPPATLEIVDSKGKVKVIDLPKLASRTSIFGTSDE